MTFKKPYKIKDINLHNIRFTDIKSNSKKTIVYLKYNNDSNEQTNLVFQSPSLLNAHKPIFKNNNYELDIPLLSKSTEKIKEFIKFLNELDNTIISQAREHPKWFNNIINNNKIKYQKIIRSSIDSKKFKNGMIKLKLINTDNFETKLNNNNRNIDVNSIQENSWVKSILEVYAIWITQDGFGLFIRPVLMSFKLNENIEYNYELTDDSEEIDDVIHTIHDNSIFIREEYTDNIQTNSIVHSVSTLDNISENKNYYEEISLEDTTENTLVRKHNLSSTSDE
uniref:Uncharacterized protein n=1 Tax=viral metagenome TaxID=1070528 RepID=A0A6C0J3J9_9ZZZZ